MVFCSNYISHHKSPQIGCRIAFWKNFCSQVILGISLLFSGARNPDESSCHLWAISAIVEKPGQKTEVCYAVFIANMSAAYGPPATRPQYWKKVVAGKKNDMKAPMICAFKKTVEYIEWLLAVEFDYPIWYTTKWWRGSMCFSPASTLSRRGSNDHWAAALWLHLTQRSPMP